MRKAYSYIRWSLGNQKHGASLSRQTQAPLVLDFIKTHKLNVVETMIDSGVSGFRGKNFSNDKALGKFIEQIRLGNIERGSVLILENMDRFGRDTTPNMIKRFIEIVESGVSIGVVAMDVIIDLEMLSSNNMIWNFVSGEIQRARAESTRKQTFSKDNIYNKVEAAKRGELIYFGGMCPSWITGIKNKSGERIVKGTADKIGVEWILRMTAESRDNLHP
jgi:DNA invertase Pin-like site-specific DNA recombinase